MLQEHNVALSNEVNELMKEHESRGHTVNILLINGTFYNNRKSEKNRSCFTFYNISKKYLSFEQLKTMRFLFGECPIIGRVLGSENICR